ncbi:hypothetical protein WIS52_16915 [Pseudonocardia nematodicida]|uniref:Uncharacterized protein n=1 Tax=Pseudonocardia nematodicida TaxID=1206997 RepID=A0ABV1KDB8_9PSEU
MGTESGHELLLRLAGRCPDELLWRLRDWLAAGSTEALAAVLPRTLLRHRIGLTGEERALLGEVVGPDSPSRRLVDAVLPGSPGPAPEFTAAEPDLAAWAASSVVAGTAEARELLVATRSDGARVLLVRGPDRTAELVSLTATLQRLLRVHGEHVPRVEVWAAAGTPGPYQEAARTAATPLWSRSPVPTG